MKRCVRLAALGVSALGLLLVASAAHAQSTSGDVTPARTAPAATASIDVAAERAVEASAVELARRPPGAELRDWHLGLELATTAALTLTASLGIVAALNQPTDFGEGACARGEAILGQEYGCTHLSTLHGVAAITATTLYTATFVVDLVAPDLPRSEAGIARDVLNIVTLTGMLTLPMLGIVSRYPGLVGVDDESQGYFSETARTFHVALAIVTAAAHLAVVIIDLARR